METLFLICAGLGGALIVCQFLAGLLGIGGNGHDAEMHHDWSADTDHDGHLSTAEWFFGFLTFRAVSAAICFFGLAGLTARYYELPHSAQLASAALAGFGALYLVATLMRMLYRLKSDGSVRIKGAVGETGTVYLRVPARKAGAGKVTLNLQNRTVELEAFTADGELATGTPIRVVAVLGPNSVEVATHRSEA